MLNLSRCVKDLGFTSLPICLKDAKALLLPQLDYEGPLHPCIRVKEDRAQVARTERAIYAFVLGKQISETLPSGQSLAHELGQLCTETRWKQQALLLAVKMQMHPTHIGSLIAHEAASLVSKNKSLPPKENLELQTFGIGNITTIVRKHTGLGTACTQREIRSALLNGLKAGPIQLAARSLPFYPIEQIPKQKTPPWQWDALEIKVLEREKALKSKALISSSHSKRAARVYTDGS